MKNAVILFVFAAQWLIDNHALSQNVLPDKIRISKGMRKNDDNFSKKFDNIVFSRELEFDLNDSSIRYRKHLDKPFKALEVIVPQSLLQPELYRKLDSLYENFENYRFSGGKIRIFKIELIYGTHNKWMLPAKVKTMLLLVADDPDEVQPEFVEELIERYIEVAPQGWISY